MPNIRPISDLRNYSEVLSDVAIGSPVFLTKNGNARYVVIDFDEYKEYEKMLAERRLLADLKEGERSGWISTDEVKAHFRKPNFGDFGD